MKLISILLFFVTLSLVGCGNSDIQGNAFIVKGGGDIKPAAGRTVYLVPESSVNSLLTRAINDVSPKVMENYKKIIEPMCAPAKETIAGLDTAIKIELQDIKDSESIHSSGCLSLQDNAVRLDGASKKIKAQHLEKIASIESELKKLITKRDVKIKAYAKSLKKQALKKVSLNLKPFMYASNYVTLVNNTDYCIKNKVEGDVFSKGVKIGSVNLWSNPSYIEDKFGFNMDCIVMPHSQAPDGNAVMKSFDRSSVTYNPVLKLFATKNNLPVNSNGYIVPDKIVTTDADFGYKPTKRKVGNSIKYTSKNVSFYSIAAKKKKYPESPRIAELKKSIDKENKRFEANSTYKDYIRAMKKSDSCNVAQEALEKATSKQSMLDQIKIEIDSCIKGEINTQSLYKSLSSLERIANAPKLPDVAVLINDAAIKQVIGIIIGEGSRKTDTTINGLFKFNKVPKGEYLLYSDYKDSFVDGFWLTPITVKEDGQFDLNNNTFVDESFDFYLTYSLANISR